MFDSGVGGLSILQEAMKKWPRANFYYCSDNANYPYGTKQDRFVIDAVHRVTEKLISRYELDVLIIACNTASTIALPVLRDSFKIPVIGVVPAIKPAAQLSSSKIIGLLATPATIKRPYTAQLIRDFAADCQIIKVGSAKLVDFAEAKVRGSALSNEMVQREIEPLFRENTATGTNKLDVVVLGCTHFALLREELEKAAKWQVTWIDTGQAIAERLFTILTGLKFEEEAEENVGPLITACFTKKDLEIIKLEGYFSWLNHGNKGFEFLDLDD